ncbi:hypothetical protein AHMF7605_28280 [Adhaeribacter arboris]|uniref:Enterobactin synthase component D n=1 Tax=Adhaeribacter arboris TaxID=2072846 RepID=A0A2T2YNL2_9BACT|nr:4'-phosphopantetheinyl transferase superfamily protein [Adhaeribacter arboris]PSR57100.1 hypothetical protein AHMF7605_28280 [Adhaeribacter arboris]
MPLSLIKKIKPGALLGRWYLTETVVQLQAQANLTAQIEIPATITHEKRKAEWIASRIVAYQMLQHFTPVSHSLLNHDTGQPYFVESPYHISISHTKDHVAVLISTADSVGIDIERVQSKVSRIQDKFLNQQEKLAIGNDLVKLTIAWSAKETLYKLYGKKNLIFNQNLILQPFDTSKFGEIEAFIRTPTLLQKYKVFFEVEDDTVLTYCFGNEYLP